MTTKTKQGQFHGATLKSTNLGDLFLCESRYLPDDVLTTHAHEHAFFCLTLGGGYSETYGRKLRDATPSHLAYHPPGEEHKVEFGHQATRCFNIELREPIFANAAGCALPLEAPADLGGELLALSIRLLAEHRENDSVSPLAAETLCSELLSGLKQEQEPATTRHVPHWLERVRDQLHESFENPPSLSQLAREASVHPVYLARAFRRFFQYSIGDYVRRLRMREACRRLADTDQPVADVSLATGFFDQSHLTRHFKRQLGTTPARFRRLTQVT